MTGLPDITVLQPKNPTNIIIETDNFVWRISSTFVRVEIVAHNELVCKELSLIAQCKAKLTNRISGAIGSVLAPYRSASPKKRSYMCVKCMDFALIN
jgi:hypothetical protein